MTQEWNLSGDVLTSRKARSALHEYLKVNAMLRGEIENKIGTVPLLQVEQEPQPMEDEHNDDVDDSSVPASAVIQQALGLVVANQETNMAAQRYSTVWRKTLFTLTRWGGFKAVGHWRTFRN